MTATCIAVLVTDALYMLPEIISIVMMMRTLDKMVDGTYIVTGQHLREPIEILNLFASFCILANASFSIVPHLMSAKFRNAIKCCRTT